MKKRVRFLGVGFLMLLGLALGTNAAFAHCWYIGWSCTDGYAHVAYRCVNEAYDFQVLTYRDTTCEP